MFELIPGLLWLLLLFNKLHPLGFLRFRLLRILLNGGYSFETVIDAKPHNICEFLNIENVERGDGFWGILLLDKLLDIGFEMSKEVVINLIVSEIEDLPDDLLHFDCV